MNANAQTLVNTILEVRYSDLELELSCCQELLAEAGKTQSDWAAAFAYTYLGDYYIAKNDTMQIGQYLFRAKELCLQNSFQDLYMQVCHFCGLYYNLLCDEQTSLQYYMDALGLARILGEIELECLILNNIADMFQCHGNYEEAKRYFFEALNKVDNLDSAHRARYSILILYSLTELFLFCSDLTTAEQYLCQCEAVLTETENDKDYQHLVVSATRCCHAALCNDGKGARIYAERLLAGCINFEDKYVVLGVLVAVCQAMIDIGDAELSWALISEFSNQCALQDTYYLQKLMGLKIHYHNIFSDEHAQHQAYKEFYNTLRGATEMENQVRTLGMKAKIYLWEMKKQQEDILQENTRLESVAHLDDLTGIYNRRYINKLCFKVKFDADTSKVGIIMLDVDYFKEYNDTYGHTKGDGVLIAVANTLSKMAKDGICPGRYGGDEFICLCLNQEDHEIERYIEAVRSELQALSIPHEASHCAPTVTLSIGYSNTVNNEHLHLEMLLEQADRALYVSKSRGRDQWSRSE